MAVICRFSSHKIVFDVHFFFKEIDIPSCVVIVQEFGSEVADLRLSWVIVVRSRERQRSLTVPYASQKVKLVHTGALTAREN